MNKFKIVPLADAFAKKIISSMTDDYDHQVTEKIAMGAGPCSVSLKPFKKGIDKRLLLTHNPFLTDNAYAQPGPVFMSSEPVEEYADIYRFPPEIKADSVNFPL